MFEDWNVIPFGNVHRNVAGRSRTFVVFAQPLAKPVHLDAYDRIALLVEAGRPPENLGGDRVLLDLGGIALSVLLPKEGDELPEIRRALEQIGRQKRLDSTPLGVEPDTHEVVLARLEQLYQRRNNSKYSLRNFLALIKEANGSAALH